MSNPTRILLVGCGRMALNHFENLQTMPELGAVVAGVDPSEEARQSLATNQGISSTFEIIFTETL